MLKTLRQNTNTNRFKTKIFIEDIAPITLHKKIIGLKEYLVKEEIKTILYSDEGIFSIENDKIFRMKAIDSDVTNIDFEGLKLIFDNSHFEKENQLSQIPSNHIVHSFTRKYYSLTKKYNTLMQLVIDETNSIPTHFYFLLNDAYYFDNLLVKKELSGFLSLLK
jgi:hypothetical protein